MKITVEANDSYTKVSFNDEPAAWLEKVDLRVGLQGQGVRVLRYDPATREKVEEFYPLKTGVFSFEVADEPIDSES